MAKSFLRIVNKIANRKDADPSATKQYQIGAFSITLPKNHNLPHYQRIHPQYDRFLPVLCEASRGSGRWIVDIGANVGDTALAVAQACDNPILCVEAEPDFFRVLKDNIAVLPGSTQRIRTVQTLVGTGQVVGELQNDGTTARLSQSAQHSHSIKSLDEILDAENIGTENIFLLKIDTDGCDADVIRSAPRTISASRPILFWENDISKMADLDDFDHLYQDLERAGYQFLWVFDNFGNVMLDECRYSDLSALNRYIASQNFDGCTRTVYYLDVLAATDTNVADVRQAVEAFRLKYMGTRPQPTVA